MSKESSSCWIDAPRWKERWEILQKLDGGGQGDAYKARRRTDGRIGFLKTIKSRKNPERRARFFREASAYDSFGVEGVPKLIESNAHQHANAEFEPFIVTEFIEGETLRSWRDSTRVVSLETAVTITSKLLDILQDSHSAGCVHRDVKPDNIILRSGDPSQVWLLDFGISFHDLADTDFQTEERQEVGNRFLRLPELSAGSLLKQDPRSDICFAAGILFYLLTGDHPDVLQDGEGRLPHQRSTALAKLQNAAPQRLNQLRALFDEAFSPLLSNRFASVQAMRGRLDRMIDLQQDGTSVEETLVALREVLDTQVDRQLAEMKGSLRQAISEVQRVFTELTRSIGPSLSISQTQFTYTGERASNTLIWSRQVSSDPILMVTYEAVPTGDELVIRIRGDAVYRTDLAKPDYGESFLKSIQAWLVAQLRMTLLDPHPLPPEADRFTERMPFGSLEAASTDAKSRGIPILAFVYDPALPERGQLDFCLRYFLQNRRTREIMNDAFVTALVPLASIMSISEVFSKVSMETARWVILDKRLQPLEQAVIYPNPQEGERIITEIAQKYSRVD